MQMTHPSGNEPMVHAVLGLVVVGAEEKGSLPGPRT